MSPSGHERRPATRWRPSNVRFRRSACYMRAATFRRLHQRMRVARPPAAAARDEETRHLSVLDQMHALSTHAGACDCARIDIRDKCGFRPILGDRMDKALKFGLLSATPDGRLVGQFLKCDHDCLPAIRLELEAFSLSHRPLHTEAERKCHACDRTDQWGCAPHD